MKWNSYILIIFLIFSCTKTGRGPSSWELVDYNCHDAINTFVRINPSDISDVAQSFRTLWKQYVPNREMYKTVGLKNGAYLGSMQDYFKEFKIPAELHKYYRELPGGVEEEIRSIPLRYLSYQSTREIEEIAEVSLVALRTFEEKVVKDLAEILEENLNTKEVMEQARKARAEWIAGNQYYSPNIKAMKFKVATLDISKLEGLIAKVKNISPEKAKMYAEVFDLFKLLQRSNDELEIFEKIRFTDVDPKTYSTLSDGLFGLVASAKVVSNMKETIGEIQSKMPIEISKEKIYGGTRSSFLALYAAFNQSTKLTSRSKQRVQKAFESVVDSM